MKLIITIPGMGKTTYVKERREEYPIGEAPFVDFDYKCGWKLFDGEVRNAHAKTIQALFESGMADVILVNPNFVNLDALPINLCEVIALFPEDPTAVQKRLEDRDGDAVFSGLVDEFVSDLRTLYESNKRRLGIVEAFADTVTAYMSEATDDLVTEEAETDETNQLTETQTEEKEEESHELDEELGNQEESSEEDESKIPH